MDDVNNLYSMLTIVLGLQSFGKLGRGRPPHLQDLGTLARSHVSDRRIITRQPSVLVCGA